MSLFLHLRGLKKNLSQFEPKTFNKGASAEEIYALVDTKPSEDDRTQSEDDYLTSLYNKTTANKSAGFIDI